MKTKSGVLILGKREREALKVLVKHSKTDISFREGGTYNKESKDSNWPFDEAEAKRAKLGMEVIDFILQITE